MRFLRFLFGVFVILSSGSTLTAEDLSMEQYLFGEALVKLGKTSYENRCSGCHSLTGDASTASSFLNPKPRNLTSGVFKFRSTYNGDLPTDEDLIRTITQGVVGSSMPAFDLVSEKEKLALVEYIKTLSSRWKEASKPRVVPLPPMPEDMFTKRTVFLKAAEEGREIYKNSCAICHGYDGKGRGPAAEALVDEWEQPIVPTNLTKPYIKSGYGVQDIFRVLATGLNGTPMAAFLDTLGADNTWKLVAYIMYLRGEAAGIYAKGTIAAIEPPQDL